jgi:polar amino acid transport system substrate-binding protein
MRTSVVSILLVATACNTLPRDAEHTSDRARQGLVRVGLVENPPWVVRTAAEPAGAEVELVRRFAGRFGARPQWFWGGEQQHMQALRRFELDLVVGGFDDRTPWAKTVGFTRPYFEERVAIGVAPSAPWPTKLKHVTVSTEAGDETAGYLRKKDAEPQRVGSLKGVSGPVAAPDWRLERLGFVPTNLALLTRKHIMATPPGENGWLRALGDFLYEQRGEVRGLLQKEERQQ